MSELTHKPAKKIVHSTMNSWANNEEISCFPVRLVLTLQCACNILNQCLLCEFKCKYNVIIERVQCDGAVVPRGAPPGGGEQARRTHSHHERADVTSYHSRSTLRERTVKGRSRSNCQVRVILMLNNIDFLTGMS